MVLNPQDTSYTQLSKFSPNKYRDVMEWDGDGIHVTMVVMEGVVIEFKPVHKNRPQ